MLTPAQYKAMLSRTGHEKQLQHIEDCHASFDAALWTAMQYGKVLSASTLRGAPASHLPCDKEVIKRAIILLCASLESPTMRSWIPVWYPTQAEHILSGQFMNNLRVNYALLAQFVPDEEAQMLARFWELASDQEPLEALIRGENPAWVLQSAQDIVEQGERTSAIRQRISEETRQAPVELDAQLHACRLTMQQQYGSISGEDTSLAPPPTLSHRSYILFRYVGALALLAGVVWAWQQPWFGRPFGIGVISVISGAMTGELLWRIGLVGREAWLEWREGNAFMLLMSLWGGGMLVLIVWLATAHLPWWAGLGASIGYCLVLPAVSVLLLWRSLWIRSIFFSPPQNPATRGGLILRNPFPDSYVHAPLPWLIACMFLWSVLWSSDELEKQVSFCRMVHRYVAIEEQRLTGSVLDGSFRIPQEDTPEGARYRLLRELGKAARDVCSPYPNY